MLYSAEINVVPARRACQDIFALRQNAACSAAPQPHRSGGIAKHEVGVQRGAGLVLLSLQGLLEAVEGLLGDFAAGMADRSQRRLHHADDREIIETDDRYILRHADMGGMGSL